MEFRHCDRSPPRHALDRPPAFLSWAFEIPVECQSDGRGGHLCHFIARIPLRCFHRLLLWMLIYYDIRKDGWYRRHACIFKPFRSRVLDRLPGSKGGSAGPTIRLDPRKLSRVSSVKTWFIFWRKKPVDPEASIYIAPTNNTLADSFERQLQSFHFILLSPRWIRNREQHKASPCHNSTNVPLRDLCRQFRPHQQVPFLLGQPSRPCRFLRKEIWNGRVSSWTRAFGCGASQPIRGTLSFCNSYPRSSGTVPPGTFPPSPFSTRPSYPLSTPGRSRES